MVRTAITWLASGRRAAVLGLLAAAVVVWGGFAVDERAPLVVVLVAITAPLIWRTPDLGLLLTMGTIPLEILGVLSDTNVPLTLSLAKLFGALTLAAWVGRVALERRRPVLWTPELGFLGAFTALATLSVAWAPDRSDALSMVIRLVSAAILYVLTINLVTSRRLARRVVTTFVVSTFAVVVFGLIQPYVVGSYTRGAVGFMEQSHTAELDLTEAAAIGELVRITGTLGFSDAYAAFLVILLPVCIFAFEFHRDRWSRAATAVVIAAVVASLVLTYSRMGFVAFCISLPLLVRYRVLRVTSVRLAVAALLVLAVLPIVPDGFWHRVLSVEQYVESTSAVKRIDMLRDGAAIAARQWFLGVGIYNLRVVMGQELDYLYGWPTPPHNMYVTVWGETGVVGLALYLGYLWQSLRGARRARRNFALGGDREMTALAGAGQVSVVMLLFCNMFLESYVVKAWWSVFDLVAALRGMSSRSEPRHDAAPEGSVTSMVTDAGRGR